MRIKSAVHQWHSWLTILLVATFLETTGCAVRRETHIHPSLVPPPARDASLDDLTSRINSQSDAFRTLVATVDFEPTAGSVYSGVIKEYHDVKGFILLEKPSMIRMVGQAPVVRTEIFDMVSDGQEFRLYIPPKQKFIVGKTTMQRTAKNSLENLRPQHILEALVFPRLDPSNDETFLEQAEDNSRRYYAVGVVAKDGDSRLVLKRKIWFDRATLEVARAQFYEGEGSYVEDVWYSDYQDFGGVRYPSHIQVVRPVEDYRLSLSILKATFNEPIAREKFELKKPEKAQLVDLSAREVNPRGQ